MAVKMEGCCHVVMISMIVMHTHGRKWHLLF